MISYDIRTTGRDAQACALRHHDASGAEGSGMAAWLVQEEQTNVVFCEGMCKAEWKLKGSLMLYVIRRIGARGEMAVDPGCSRRSQRGSAAGALLST